MLITRRRGGVRGKWFLSVATVLALPLNAEAIAGGPFGGPCFYDDTPGLATIVSVEPAAPGQLACSNDPVVVLFDFQASGNGVRSQSATNVPLTIGEGQHPARVWVESEGLVVGSEHKCIRRDLKSGTCTPILYHFPELDYDAGLTACYQTTTFAMTVFPLEVDNSVAGQQIVVLVSVDNHGFQAVSQPVHITADAIGADVRVDWPDIFPSQVCEITVTPWPPDPQRDDVVNGVGRVECLAGGDDVITVQVRGERDGFHQDQSVAICVLPGDNTPPEMASVVRDRFVSYLAECRPELGISAQTEWTGTVVKPYWWVVTHYLFFSDEWEMGVVWHNMIPPYDWSRMYLRPRHTHMSPLYAFEISSMSAQPPLEPIAIPPPPVIDR